MRIIGRTGKDDIANVYIAETSEGKIVEFAESLQPPLPIEEKWIITISTLKGCPVKCKFCDAGNFYAGKLSKEEILFQIEYLVQKRFPCKKIPVKKFKVQFGRMGEPCFNNAVLDVLEILPSLYDARGLVISFSTIAPDSTQEFFEKLLEIKEKYYRGKFQFQFSIHTTDPNLRDYLIPVKKWNFEKISEYGKRFKRDGDKKITLNFALAQNFPLDPFFLLNYFSPDIFLIKITPVNPTYNAKRNKIYSLLPLNNENEIVSSLRSCGYEVIISIGELEENLIGSNCGQYVWQYKKKKMKDAYTYEIQEV